MTEFTTDSAAPKVTRVPRSALLLLASFAAVLAVTWFVTIQTSTQLGQLLGLEAAGIAPATFLAYFALVTVMMAAMMIPSALPMVTTYRSVTIVDAGSREATVRAGLFSAAYLGVWALFTALALLVLQAFGLMGTLSGPVALIPGGLLMAAGAYQFTSWKQSCLGKCRSPLSFLITRWKSGRSGALRMGLDHSLYCLGCCWLLMLVVFVTGAMSLLWMGVFTGLILVEKVWSRGVAFSRAIGGVAVGVGFIVTGFALGGLPL